MENIVRVKFLALLACLGLLGAVPAQATDTAFGAEVVYLDAQLTGVPGVRGSALVRLKDDQMTFALSWSGISAPTLGWIHGEDIAVVLFGSPMPDTVSAAAGKVTITDRAITDAVRRAPEHFEITLRTKEGNVLGRLGKRVRGGDVLRRFPFDGDQALLTAQDPDSRALATAVLRPNGPRMGFTLLWSGFTPSHGSVHKGANAVVLLGGPVPREIFAVSGTVSGLDPAVVSGIARHAKDYDVELTGAGLAGGGVRGGLS